MFGFKVEFTTRGVKIIKKLNVIYLEIDPSPVKVKLDIKALKEIVESSLIDIYNLEEFFNTLREMINRNEKDTSLSAVARSMEMDAAELWQELFILEHLSIVEITIVNEADPNYLESQLVINQKSGFLLTKFAEEEL